MQVSANNGVYYRCLFAGLGQWKFLPHRAQDLVHSVLQRGPIHHASGSYYYPVLQDLYISEGD